jgi:hypothetical protein
MRYVDSPPGPGGSKFGFKGGGNPGTSTGSTGISGFPIGENGGVFAPTYYLMVPTQNISGQQCYLGIYDTSSFDDPVDGSSYSYRSEDINPLRVPTVRRVGLIYRDLGLATLTVSISATNDNGQVVSASTTVQLGNTVPTNALLTELVDITVVGFRPQLTLSRAAAGGPISISSVTMIGTIEDTQL